ncbi:MAG: PTS sugar transporter subunit IIC [Elusimicrobia bacterium]|nr:PTS sugar transporter subunit IIC [Elusimicrobiota bacterium]
MITAAACALLAVLELDAVMIAQTLASRPLVVGALIGALTGKAQAGLLFGAAYELLSLCDLPVGGCLTWSAPVAAGTATLLASRGTSFSLCFAGGVAAGVLHSRVEALERSRRASTGDALALQAEAGGRTLGRALAVSIASHAAMTFATAWAVVAFVGFLDLRWWTGAPRFLQSGAALVSSSAPWIGLSGVTAWGLRRS